MFWVYSLSVRVASLPVRVTLSEAAIAPSNHDIALLIMISFVLRH